MNLPPREIHNAITGTDWSYWTPDPKERRYAWEIERRINNTLTVLRERRTWGTGGPRYELIFHGKGENAKIKFSQATVANMPGGNDPYMNVFLYAQAMTNAHYAAIHNPEQ